LRRSSKIGYGDSPAIRQVFGQEFAGLIAPGLISKTNTLVRRINEKVSISIKCISPGCRRLCAKAGKQHRGKLNTQTRRVDIDNINGAEGE